MKADDTRHTLGRTKVPATLLGYGGAAISNMYTPVTESDAAASIEAAWDAGIRVFDTAPLYGYGLAERRMGDVLRSKPRDEFILSTKVGRLLQPRNGLAADSQFPHSPLPFNPVFDYSYSAAMRSVEDSLQRLGMDRIDVLLIHDIGIAQHGEEAHPELFATCMDGAGKAIAELKDQGIVGAIGIGANEWQVFVEALTYIDFDVFLMAGRYSLLEHSDPYENLFPVLEKHNAKLFIGGAFNSGILAAKSPEQHFHNYEPANKEMVTKVDQLRERCASLGVELPTAAIQFPAAHPCVATVVVGARSKNEIVANVEGFATQLPENFWSELDLDQYRS